jgi:protein-S-isoprenylcysteine O-methyltransferase Ste14
VKIIIFWDGMGDSMLKEKTRHLLEAMFTALLFGTQTILDAGWAVSVMSTPLLPYLIYFLKGQAYPEREIQVLFFSKYFMVGRIIALIGFAVLLLAVMQFLWNRAGGVGLIKTGAYSVVRHPQFTGIIIVTIGLTVMVLTLGGHQLQIVVLWMMQILGYIGIARYEETHLLKRFGENFRQYKRDIPFIFPIKCPSRIPETLFTVLIAALICCFLLVFPYNLIHIH